MEELTKVAEIIAGLGDSGVRAFTIYMIAIVLKQAMTCGTVLLVFWTIGKAVARAVRAGRATE